MMDDQPPPRSADAATEPITLKNRFTQTTEPAPGVVLAVVAKAAAAQTFHFNGPLSTRAQQVQLSRCPSILQPRCRTKARLPKWRSLWMAVIPDAAIAAPDSRLAVARAD
jgi:hypothetical protein